MNPISLFEALLVLGMGIAFLFWPRGQRDRAEARHDQAVAERNERGSDSFFEEKRSLEAYKPIRSLAAYRLIGLICVILGGGYLASQFS